MTNFLNYSLYLYDILKNSRATCSFTNNVPLTPDNPQTSLWAVCIGIFSPVQSCSSAVMSVDHVEKPGHRMWKDKFLFLFFFKYYLFIVQQNYFNLLCTGAMADISGKDHLKAKLLCAWPEVSNKKKKFFVGFNTGCIWLGVSTRERLCIIQGPRHSAAPYTEVLTPISVPVYQPALPPPGWPAAVWRSGWPVLGMATALCVKLGKH